MIYWVELEIIVTCPRRLEQKSQIFDTLSRELKATKDILIDLKNDKEKSLGLAIGSARQTMSEENSLQKF